MVVHSVGVTVCRQAECILFSMQFNHKQQDKTEYKLNTQKAQNWDFSHHSQIWVLLTPAEV